MYTLVAEIHALQRDQHSGSDQSGDVNNAVPEHLFERCTSDLSSSDKRKARDLLIRYAHLFSKTEEDVGRTKLVKHKIDTGDKAPIKQQPRRLPIHMQHEVETHISDMLRREVS